MAVGKTLADEAAAVDEVAETTEGKTLADEAAAAATVASLSRCSSSTAFDKYKEEL